jgi:four helix bundle protein
MRRTHLPDVTMSARLETKNEGCPMAESYRDLRVWQGAVDLVLNIYTETQGFPKQELYGLVSQMRRAAISIPSNIAEGKGRLTDRDRAHFFYQARGSLLELETQILIAQKLRYIADPSANSLIKRSEELGRMLNALIQSLKPGEKSRHSAA